MSTSILYHAFGIKGYKYVRTHCNEENVVFTIEKKPFSLRCSCCNGKDVIRRGATLRWFHAIPIGKKATYIKANIPRVECKCCHTIRQINICFADSMRIYTRSLERYVLELSKHMTIKDVAVHLGLSWDIVEGVQKRYL